MIDAATQGHVNVNGPCYHKRPGEFPCSVLLLEAMLMSVAHVTIKDHEDVNGLTATCLWVILPLEVMLIFGAAEVPEGF